MKNNRPHLFSFSLFAFFAFTLLLGGPAPRAHAQSDCKDRLARADKAFKDGRFREVRKFAEEVVHNTRCERQDMVFALRLISLSFIAEDEPDSVRHTVERILTLKRSFMPDPLDPLMFKQLIEESKEDIAYADAMMVSVASQSVSDLREAPSAVTVFTAEQMQILGVRDLMDLMAFVPGFEITQDFGNVRNIAVRGNAAGEGKILLLVDGHIVNETSYGFAPIGQRFPIYLIERVEIIRGPGSASYGGFAGLAVVSITTKTGAPKTGGQVHASYELSKKEKLRQTGDFWLANQTQSGFRYSVSGGFSSGQLTNEKATNFQGQHINYGDSSGVRSRFINADVQYKGLKVNLLHEDYRLERTERYATETIFGGYYLRAEYEMELTEDITFTPRLRWMRQDPWNILTSADSEFANINREWRPGFTLHWQPKEDYYFTLGGEHYRMKSSFPYSTPEDSIFLYDTERVFNLHSTAFFGEAFYRTPWANITLGARYERHSEAGSAFVPRVSITKAFKNFHYKLLYNQAFRTPSVQNILLAPNLEVTPERIRALEAEFGYKVPGVGHFTLNLFDMRIEDNMVYHEQSSINAEGDTLYYYYSNEGNGSGTRGFELQGHFQLSEKFAFTTSYAYYTPTSQDEPLFEVAGEEQVYQGLAAHKFHAFLNWQPFSRMVLTPSLTYRSERFTDVLNPEGEFFMHREAPFVGINACAEFRNLFHHGLHLQLGVYNLLNTFQWNSIAYTTGINPVPITGRSFSIRVFYQWKPL